MFAERIPACLSCVASQVARTWSMPMDGVEDEEGARVDATLPFAVDAHVHLFPGPLFEAIWRWFDVHGWPIRYKLQTPEVVAFLSIARDRSRGGAALLPQAGHGARHERVHGRCRRGNPRVTGLARCCRESLMRRAILEEAFARGLAGVKLHCHVQCFVAGRARARRDLRNLRCMTAARDARRPRAKEPRRTSAIPTRSAHADRTAACPPSVPEASRSRSRTWAPTSSTPTARLLEEHDNLWLDTTMTLAGYFPADPLNGSPGVRG